MNAVPSPPEGYMTNAQGHLVAMDLVKPVDRLRDDLVRSLLTKADALHAAMRDFKVACMEDISAFLDIAVEQYDVRLGGDLGNVTLRSYDGTQEVRVQIAKTIRFSEGLLAAEKLVGDCVTEWSADARPELRAIVERAFRTDKDGNVSTSAVLALRRLNITDPRWQRAMAAIADAIDITGTKSYVRFYRRAAADLDMTAVSLDLAKL